MLSGEDDKLGGGLYWRELKKESTAVPIWVEPAVAELPVRLKTSSICASAAAWDEVPAWAWVCCWTRCSSTRSRTDEVVTPGPEVARQTPTRPLERA